MLWMIYYKKILVLKTTMANHHYIIWNCCVDVQFQLSLFDIMTHITVSHWHHYLYILIPNCYIKHLKELQSMLQNLQLLKDTCKGPEVF